MRGQVAVGSLLLVGLLLFALAIGSFFVALDDGLGFGEAARDTLPEIIVAVIPLAVGLGVGWRRRTERQAKANEVSRAD